MTPAASLSPSVASPLACPGWFLAFDDMVDLFPPLVSPVLEPRASHCAVVGSVSHALATRGGVQSARLLRPSDGDSSPALSPLPFSCLTPAFAFFLFFWGGGPAFALSHYGRCSGPSSILHPTGVVAGSLRPLWIHPAVRGDVASSIGSPARPLRVLWVGVIGPDAAQATSQALPSATHGACWTVRV